MLDREPKREAAYPPLDTEDVLWVAALDRVPIEERVEWVKTLAARVEEINEARGSHRSPLTSKCWHMPERS